MYTQWVAGYLAGYAVASADLRKPLRRDEAPPDMSTRRAWLEKYCKENPLAQISGVAASLQKELQK
jgi:hypothetical protein